MTTPQTTICIPAYKAEGFVQQAIESALAQTDPDIKVIISVDPAGDGTEAICMGYANDPRVTVRINEKRLGWVGNANACLDLIDTPFFAFCFHDDRLDPEFVSKLRAVLEANPTATAAFGTIQYFGNRDHVVTQSDLTGPAAQRAATRMTGQAGNAYSLKNLMRSGPVKAGLRMAELPEGYFADWPFAIAYALAGEYLSVEDPIYRKRLWDASVTAGWQRVPLNERIKMEIAMRQELISVIQTSDALTWSDKAALTELALTHIFGQPAKDESSAALRDAIAGQIPAKILTGLMSGPATGNETSTLGQKQIAGEILRNAQFAARDKDRVGAVAGAQKALRRSPDLPDAHLMAGRLLLALSEPGTESAQEHLRQALGANPDNWQARLALTRALLRAGALDEARTTAEPLSRLAPSDTPGLKQVMKRLGLA
ncbi:glycosyltransferase [Thalassococcus lentus]|uniref:Glycosyltransferase n=1 Tax=Thalassococcus lentus TaxID=1210524 RepID=A0ABT4XR93_9RHOB|nr:glycosyltransferase [Thalassococcus lentus]MDA7424477.1 glycosyltransferase [Thalassococcus lentus]